MCHIDHGNLTFNLAQTRLIALSHEIAPLVRVIQALRKKPKKDLTPNYPHSDVSALSQLNMLASFSHAIKENYRRTAGAWQSRNSNCDFAAESNYAWMSGVEAHKK